MMRSFILASALILAFGSQAQTTVQEAPSPEIIASLLAGVGVEVQQVTITCDSLAYATFSGEAPLPMSGGLVLSSGETASLPLPAIETSGHSHFSPGDPDLEQIMGYADPWNDSRDACMVEIDLVPLGDSLALNFSMGSEEYPGYVCTPLSDAIGILLSGPGIAGSYSNAAINLATLPGSASPVCVNTVNGGEVGELDGDSIYCAGLDPDWYNNTNYYIDNLLGPDLVLNGLTVTFTARAAVVSGAVYHLKLVVADFLDELKDTMLFLEAVSLRSQDDLSTDVVTCQGSSVHLERYPDRMIVHFPIAVQGEGRVFDTKGALVRVLPVRSDRMDIAFDGLSAGAYTVHIPQRPEIRPLRFVVVH